MRIYDMSMTAKTRQNNQTYAVEEIFLTALDN